MEAPTIVSLVPSLTELVFFLGRGDLLIGRTRFCEEPAGEVERVPIVGGTKNPRIDRIIGLRPGLVLANREENRREDVEAIQAAGLRTLVTDPNTVPEAVAMIREVGQVVGGASEAEALAAEIERALAVPLPETPRRVFAAVWNEPLLALGCESYGHDLLLRAGARNVYEDIPRYPETTMAELAERRPDLILLPDEPYPFKAEHAARFRQIAPTRIIDGKLLWWYGPRIPASLTTLRHLLEETNP